MNKKFPILATLACAGTLSLLPAQGERPPHAQAAEAHAHIHELAKLLQAERLDREAQARARELVAELQELATRYEASARAPGPRPDQIPEKARRVERPRSTNEVAPEPERVSTDPLVKELHERIGRHLESMRGEPRRESSSRRVSEPAPVEEARPARAPATPSPHAHDPFWPANPHPAAEEPMRARAPGHAGHAGAPEATAHPGTPSVSRRSPELASPHSTNVLPTAQPPAAPATPRTDAELRSVVEDLRAEMAEVRRLVREIRELAGKHHEGPMLR